VDPVADVDWSMGSHAARLADWDVAIQLGKRVAGAGPPVPPEDRARMREDLAQHVLRAEELVASLTDLHVTGFRSRAWAMGRGDWIRQNVGGLQRLMEPLAQRLLESRPTRPSIARKAVGAQAGAILGYVSRRVLGQYDVFLPPDDEGLIYFVGPNLIEAERRYALTPADFRLWVAVHEVTHRVQFSAAPWLRSFLRGMVDEYLGTVSLDPHQLMDQLKHAVEEAKTGTGPGGFLRLLTPEQRAIFDRTQAMMARRQVRGVEHRVQRAIGFDQKVAQYDSGERFVREIVDRIGMSGFNLVWESREHLPEPDEVGDPARWIARITR
jgi:coenzyme F420 biosynthesis associated uncharacterized protein